VVSTHSLTDDGWFSTDEVALGLLSHWQPNTSIWLYANCDYFRLQLPHYFYETSPIGVTETSVSAIRATIVVRDWTSRYLNVIFQHPIALDNHLIHTTI
jgi:hypothetical protein